MPTVSLQQEFSRCFFIEIPSLVWCIYLHGWIISMDTYRYTPCMDTMGFAFSGNTSTIMLDLPLAKLLYKTNLIIPANKWDDYRVSSIGYPVGVFPNWFEHDIRQIGNTFPRIDSGTTSKKLRSQDVFYLSKNVSLAGSVLVSGATTLWKSTWNLKITHLKRQIICHPFLGSILIFQGVYP